MKCSGERSHALRVATAPAGNSLRDLPVPFLELAVLPLGSSPSEWLAFCTSTMAVVAFASAFVVAFRLLRWYCSVLYLLLCVQVALGLRSSLRKKLQCSVN